MSCFFKATEFCCLSEIPPGIKRQRYQYFLKELQRMINHGGKYT